MLSISMRLCYKLNRSLFRFLFVYFFSCCCCYCFLLFMCILRGAVAYTNKLLWEWSLTDLLRYIWNDVYSIYAVVERISTDLRSSLIRCNGHISFIFLWLSGNMELLINCTHTHSSECLYFRSIDRHQNQKIPICRAISRVCEFYFAWGFEWSW